jgi:esterase
MQLLAHDVLDTASSSSAHGLVFAHGILGSRNNWRSFARRVHEADPRWRIVLVDLRNHGESHGLAGPHTLAACADDVARVIAHVGLARTVVVGHSYGGKVMLELASRTPPGLLAAWILDAPAGVRDLGSGLEEIERVIAAVRAVPLPIATRRDLVDHLTGQGLSERLAQWMTTNLKNAPGGGLEWKFALDTIPELLASFGQADYWPFIEGHAGLPELHLVRGGKSDRWSDDELDRTARADALGHVHAHLMPSAGHWLHTDDPELLWRIMQPTLPR